MRFATAGAIRVAWRGQSVKPSIRPRYFARRDSFRSEWDEAGQVEWLDSAGISLARGRGVIDRPRTVRVTHDGRPDQILRARHAVPSYPTVGEIWPRLLETVEKRRQQERPETDPFMPV